MKPHVLSTQASSFEDMALNGLRFDCSSFVSLVGFFSLQPLLPTSESFSANIGKKTGVTGELNLMKVLAEILLLTESM